MNVPPLLQHLSGDLRFALRSMRKSPAFTAVAVLSLALGIGANTAIFTLVDTVLLRLLPVQSPGELYIVMQSRGAGSSPAWTYPDYHAIATRNTTFQGIAAHGLLPAGFTAEGDGADQPAQLVQGVFVTGNYFDVLGVKPLLGRTLNMEDNRAEGVGPNIVLSYAFWQRRFNGEARVIGRKARVNGSPVTVVGVAPKGFEGVELGRAPDFFVPAMMRTAMTDRGNWNNRNNSWLLLIGRIKPGVQITRSEAELHVITRQEEQAERRTRADHRHINSAGIPKLLPGSQGYSGLRIRLGPPLIILMVVVGLVLLIACANVANLLLAQAAARQREIAVRLAIGAGRARLIGQLLTESIVLSLAGGVLGLGLSFFGVAYLMRFIPQGGFVPIRFSVSPDWRILVFTLAVSLLTGILFGLVPALQATRPSLSSALKEEGAGSTAGRSRFNLRKALVAAQVALSLLLLIGAGLFLRSLQNLDNLDTGFRRTHVVSISIDPGRNGYKGQRVRDFYERLREAAENAPGVLSASLSSITPLAGSRWNQNVSVEGRPWKDGERSVIDQNAVGPRFFETFGIPMIAGRDFRVEDNPSYTRTIPEGRPFGPQPEELEGPRVVIVNEHVANRFFPNENPIGKRLSLTETYAPERSYEIVGVVKAASYFGLRGATEGMIYQSAWRPGAAPKQLNIRTSGDIQPAVDAVRSAARELDPTIPILSVNTIEQMIDSNIMQEKLIASLSSFFGAVALLLAAVGLYGVMAHMVTRRRREIGIRMALGAQRGAVMRLVLWDAMLMVITGAAIGIPIALSVTHFARTFLYGVEARDPLSTVFSTLVLLAVAGLASYLPARRATRVDPMVALRYE
jgi:predicted permease